MNELLVIKNHINRSKWRSAHLCAHEPEDFFAYKKNGLMCVVHRHETGFWIGDIEIPIDLYEHAFDMEKSEKLMRAVSSDREMTRLESLRHITERFTQAISIIERDSLFVGFGCNHWGDASPYDLKIQKGETYKTLDYVKRQCDLVVKNLNIFAFQNSYGEHFTRERLRMLDEDFKDYKKIDKARLAYETLNDIRQWLPKRRG